MAAHLLALPPAQAVAEIGLDFLAEAELALPRVADPDDPEGLHDFRVALRRLRSLLRSYRGFLEQGPSRKQLRRLKRLAQATNEARDLEVTVAWLDAEGPTLEPLRRAAAEHWRARVDAQRVAAYGVLLADLEGRFAATAGPLRRRLERLRAGAAGGPTFATVTAGLLTALIAELHGQLAAIHSPRDVDAAHRARITGKRIRYLITPLRAACPRCRDAEQSLKALQDVLGDLHDAHVRAVAIEGRAAEAGAGCAVAALRRGLREPDYEPDACPELPGLLAVARHNGERVEALFRQLADGWLDDAGAALGAALAAAAAQLGASPPKAD